MRHKVAETEQRYRLLLTEQARSGLSVRAFARTRGVAAGTLSLNATPALMGGFSYQLRVNLPMGSSIPLQPRWHARSPSPLHADRFAPRGASAHPAARPLDHRTPKPLSS